MADKLKLPEERRIGQRFSRAVVLLALASSSITTFAQPLPTVGTKVSGKVPLGRNTIVLPPGEWEVIWTGNGTSRVIGEAARIPNATFLAAQKDESGSRVRALVYHVSTLVSFPAIDSWNTSACDTKNALYNDFSGNFKFPECLIIDYWMPPNTRPVSTGLNKSIWDWSTANNLKLPVTFVVVRYIKYKGGDYLQTHVSMNPEAFGLPESIQRERASSEWNATQLKADAIRASYIDDVKKWGSALAEQASPTVGGGPSKAETLPALPQAKK